MAGVLQWVVAVIAGAGILLVLFVFAREGVRHLVRRRWRAQLARCLNDIRTRLNSEIETEPKSVARELAARFSASVISAALQELRPEGAPNQKLTDIAEALGIIDQEITLLRTARSWHDRAEAVCALMGMPHPKVVQPLLEAIQDATEDREVRETAIQALKEIRDPRAVGPLIEALKKAPPTAAQLIADTLTSFGTAASELLAGSLLDSGSEDARFWSARALGAIQDARASGSLIRALSDQSPRVRAEAATALGKIGDKLATASLRKVLLEDPVTAVRDAAAEALSLLDIDLALSTFRDGLSNLGDAARRGVITSLERLGAQAAPLFVDALCGGSADASHQAALSLERMGVVAEWVRSLAGEEWEIVLDHLIRIARFGLIETIGSGLSDENSFVRIRTCRVLSESRDFRAGELLTKAAEQDDDETVRAAAIQALIRRGQPETHPTIRKAIAEESVQLREAAVEALALAESGYLEPLRESLSRLLQDPHARIRWLAVQALTKVMTDETGLSVVKALEDGSADVRETAALALCRWRPETATLRDLWFSALLSRLRDAELRVRKAAIEALSTSDDPRMVVPLVEALEWADRKMRVKIADSLATIPRTELFRLTESMMSHPVVNVRAGLASTLWLIGDDRALPTLRIFLEDPEPVVRSAAVGAVGSFRRPEVTSLLLRQLEDPDERVRAATVNALGKCGGLDTASDLVRWFDREPDLYVQCRIVLAIGTIATSHLARERMTDESALRALRAKASAWATGHRSLSVRAAALITLALLNDPDAFYTVFRALHEEKPDGAMHALLADLSSDCQDRFFTYLSLDAKLFWNGQLDQSTDHYRALLRSSRNPVERVHAVRVLAALLSDPKNAAVVEAAFHSDPNPDVRASALQSLGTIYKGARLIDAIERAAQDPSPVVRRALAFLFDTLPPEAFEPSRERLLELIHSAEPELKTRLIQLFALLFRGDWSPLSVRLIKSESISEKVALIEILGLIADPAAEQLLLDHMDHPDASIRSAITRALSTAPQLSRESDWIQFLSDPSDEVRHHLLVALAQNIDDELLAALVPHVQDPSREFRLILARTLGERRNAVPNDAKALLSRLCEDSDALVSAVAMISIYRFNDSSILPRLRKQLDRLTSEERSTCLTPLKADGYFSGICATLKKSRSPQDRYEAVQALSVLSPVEHRADLMAALNDPAEAVRMAALEGLRTQAADPEVWAAIRALEKDPSEAVREILRHLKRNSLLREVSSSETG